jgi:hypothetical protein
LVISAIFGAVETIIYYNNDSNITHLEYDSKYGKGKHIFR